MSRLNSDFRKYSISSVVLFVLVSLSALAQTAPSLAPDLRSKIDGIAHQVLQTTGVPSASLAVVKDGKVVYLQAYGDARLDPRTPAQPQMRYSNWVDQQAVHRRRDPDAGRRGQVVAR